MTPAQQPPLYADYQAYTDACRAAEQPVLLTFQAWLVARLNQLDAQVRELTRRLDEQEAGK